MPQSPYTLRGWIIPAALVVTATLLTVPWSYWVIKAAYDRDVLDNAKSLARRVELRVLLSAPRGSSPPAEAAEALRTELTSDPTVQLAVFYNLTAPRPEPIGWMRQGTGNEADFRLSDRDIRRRATSGTLVEQTEDRYIVSVPWVRGQYVVGFTYLEMSRSAIADEFWKKEGSLVTRVVGLTAAAILILSILGSYAYSARLKVTSVKQHAELSRLGLLAERGLTAAVLAHEIRNPLAALRFQLHSLRKNADDSTRVAGTADTIDTELSRIQQLVSDYLEHERAQTMRVQPVDLEDSARSLQTLLAELFRQTRTEFNVIAAPEPVVVTADPHALRQVLMNLVLNAQQAMGEGGHITLAVSADAAEGFGRIDVTDTGPGIPPEMRERLFKPFQTTRSEGHGIGLALVKRFVDNFGGSVSVDSEPGKGSTFHLKLPLAERPRVGPASANETPIALENPT